VLDQECGHGVDNAGAIRARKGENKAGGHLDGVESV
jgi:hypothetical protein